MTTPAPQTHHRDDALLAVLFFAQGLPTGLAPHTYAYVKKIQALSCFFLDSRRFGVNLPISTEFKALPSDIDLPVLDNGN